MLDISLFSIVHCSLQFSSFFFFNDTATTEIYTLSLHDALPILLTLEPGSTRRSPRTDRSTGARREQRPRGRRHRAGRPDPVAELRPGASREAAAHGVRDVALRRAAQGAAPRAAQVRRARHGRRRGPRGGGQCGGGRGSGGGSVENAPPSAGGVRPAQLSAAGGPRRSAPF